MELIDKQKLLEYLGNGADRIYVTPLISMIESGTFDDHSAQEEIERQHRLLDNEVEIKERLREEIAKLKEGLSENLAKKTAAYESIEEWQARAIQAEQERNALLEGLKWYAEHLEQNHTLTRGTGNRARSIIAKITQE